MVGSRLSALFLVLVILTACNGQGGAATPTEPSQALDDSGQSANQTATNTPQAPAIVNTATQRSASSCDPGQTLDALRETLPVDEYAVHYNVSRGVASLVIWSVDAEIPVPMTEVQISESVDLAWVHAGRMAIAAVNANSCVRDLFDAIDAIVVDSAYAGWFSGQVRIADIPSGATAVEIDDSFLMVLDSFNVTYLRQSVVQSVPEGLCDWPEALQNIWGHFSPDRPNVAFYYTIDEFGGNVWAQWDGPPEDAVVMASIMNMMLALDCFNPQANIIAIVVDESGQLIRIAVVPQMNLADIQISTP